MILILRIRPVEIAESSPKEHALNVNRPIQCLGSAVVDRDRLPTSMVDPTKEGLCVSLFYVQASLFEVFIYLLVQHFPTAGST